MLHSNLAAQLDSAQKKIRELELANTVLMSEREELNERLKERVHGESFYHEQYHLLVCAMAKIPAWIKSFYGV